MGEVDHTHHTIQCTVLPCTLTDVLGPNLAHSKSQKPTGYGPRGTFDDELGCDAVLVGLVSSFLLKNMGVAMLAVLPMRGLHGTLKDLQITSGQRCGEKTKKHASNSADFDCQHCLHKHHTIAVHLVW